MLQQDSVTCRIDMLSVLLCGHTADPYCNVLLLLAASTMRWSCLRATVHALAVWH